MADNDKRTLNGNSSSENENENEEPNIITLTDDDGQNVDFELLDIINYSGTDYAVLVPADENAEGADEVLIFRVDDGQKDVNTLTPVTNEGTARAIFELFKTKNQNRFDFA